LHPGHFQKTELPSELPSDQGLSNCKWDEILFKFYQDYKYNVQVNLKHNYISEMLFTRLLQKGGKKKKITVYIPSHTFRAVLLAKND
jgi:hypothetical protein